MEFSKNDPKVARLVTMCYPSYKGRRKVKVSAKQRCRVNDYWDGGSRDYVEFVHLPTNRILSLDQVEYEKQERGNPFNQNLGYVTLTPDIAAVEHSIFCGKPGGIRIALHPDTYAKWESEQ